MGKIKLNLVSGAVVEKPLINAFKANNNTYVVLDNEVNGSMGLPIILVCKLVNEKLTKILDQNEWNIVKEYLKNIIAGNQIEFVSINNEMLADDIYYTQLTLPVPSYDALKNAYKVVETVTANVEHVNNTPIIEQSQVVIPQVEISQPIPTESDLVSPIVESVNAPIIEPTPAPVSNASSAPVIDIPVSGPVVEQSQVVMPQIEIPQPTPIEVVSPVSPMPINPIIENEVVEAPQVNDTQNIGDSSANANIFKDQKEAFMLACENMFDALVQKFEKELENYKN